MKNLVVILFILLPLYVFGSFETDYIEAMRASIETLFEAQEIAEYTEISNSFERIALASPGKWHPHYYLALTKILMSSKVLDPESVDDYLDQAQSALEKAMSIHQKPHSELSTLQGFIHMLRIPVDAANRGPEYSGIAMMEMNKAIELDSLNPRAHYIMASMQMGTAQFFGSDLSEACNTLKKSLTLFADDVNSQEHPLEPAWGKEWAEALKPRCKESR